MTAPLSMDYIKKICKLKADYRHTDKGQTVQPGEHTQTNKRMDGRTIPSTLSPSFAVDN